MQSKVPRPQTGRRSCSASKRHRGSRTYAYSRAAKVNLINLTHGSRVLIAYPTSLVFLRLFARPLQTKHTVLRAQSCVATKNSSSPDKLLA